MQPKNDPFSFEAINRAAGFIYPKEEEQKPEENVMSPGYVSVDPYNGDRWTGD